MIGNIAFGMFGLAVLISFAYMVSSNKKSIDWKQIAAGVGLQIAFAVIVILVPGGREFFDCFWYVRAGGSDLLCLCGVEQQKIN